MIYTAKKENDNWIVVDADNETVAKAKIQFKNKNAYGKIIVDNQEIELLYNSHAFVNKRPRVNIFTKKQENNAVYRVIKRGKKFGFYACYQLRLSNHSYYCYRMSHGNNKSLLYVYDNNKLVCVMESLVSKPYEIVDLYLILDDYLTEAFLLLISMQVFSNYKKIGVSEYAPGPLHKSDLKFISQIKEQFLKENSYD